MVSKLHLLLLLDMVREDHGARRWLVGEILMVRMLEVLDSISRRFLCDEARSGCNNLSYFF